MNTDTAIVVIGRNEGRRLEASLDSVARGESPVLYVDSASSDGSAEVAEGRGVPTVRLGSDEPLSAARSRNAGFAEIRERHPEAVFVQFVDGDSALEPGWVEAGRAFLADTPGAGIVAGTVREADREGSVYRRLLDMEWNGPTGEVRSVGGICMARAEAFERAGGFDDRIIAGEEADLCLRVRGAGYGVHRLPVPMARHDSGMVRFGQWFRRSVRSGVAYTEAAARDTGEERAPDARQVRSFLIWGALLPAFALAAVAAAPFFPLALTGLALPALGYAALFLRIAAYRRSLGDVTADARLYAAFCILAKAPQSLGFVLQRLNRLRGRPTGLVDKRPDPDREEAG